MMTIEQIEMEIENARMEIEIKKHVRNDLIILVKTKDNEIQQMQKAIENLEIRKLTWEK